MSTSQIGRNASLNFAVIACVALGSLLTGCVTGTRSIDVGLERGSVPEAPAATKGNVVFANVTDVRHFENKPGDPSTPSVDGDVNKMSDFERSRYIGRQRNTFGHAMGDIALPDGKTVQTKMVEIMTDGLRQRGYSVVASDPDAKRVSIEVQDFWTWMTPGFFALSFEARIGCKVTIVHDGKETVFQVRGYALNHGQVAKDKNWQEAFEEAFADYLKDFDLQMKANGL